MSHLPLANLLNGLARSGHALITEGETSISVAGLTEESTRQVVAAATEAGWAFAIYDKEQNEYETDEISDDLGPLHIPIQKPARTPEERLDTLYIATEDGFSDYLKKGHPARYWRLLELGTPFNCQTRSYGDWDVPMVLSNTPTTKSPRLLVKESANVRLVPDDIRYWLLSEGTSLTASEPLHHLWATHAFVALSRCIANEVDLQGMKLIFKGPPKLNLEFDKTFVASTSSIELDDFQSLHDAAVWVYESSKEAEVKHILLATEIARSGRADGEATAYFKDHLNSAFECAKIAYQMSVSEITKDTLKSLGDLRKAITDETSKAIDATRQTITAISTALTVGIGLIAARIAVGIQPALIIVVMVVAFLYTLMIVFTGWRFISIQRTLRQEWQPKLYRFLSKEEYEKMVNGPATSSESAFARSAGIGITALVIMMVGVIIFGFVAEPIKKSPDQTPVTPVSVEAQKPAPQTEHAPQVTPPPPPPPPPHHKSRANDRSR